MYKKKQIVLFLIIYYFLSISDVNCESTWKTQLLNESSTIISEYLQSNQGSISWCIEDYNTKFRVQMYGKRGEFEKYIVLEVYLNGGINKKYPFYNNTAHLEISFFYNSRKQNETLKIAGIRQNVQISSNTLKIKNQNANLIIHYEEEKISLKVLVLLMLLTFIKIGCLYKADIQRHTLYHKIPSLLPIILALWQVDCLLIVRKYLWRVNFDLHFGFFEAMFFIVFVGLIFAKIVYVFLIFQSLVNIKHIKKILIFIPFGVYIFSVLLFNSQFILYTFTLAFIPQIIFDFIKRRKNGPYPFFIIIYVANIIFISTILFDSENQFRINPNRSFVVQICFIAFLQHVIMIIQSKNPVLFFNYYIKKMNQRYLVEIDMTQTNQRCQICKQSFKIDNNMENVTSNAAGVKKGTTVKGICVHSFHFKCLKKQVESDNWRCPNCLKDVPALLYD